MKILFVATGNNFNYYKGNFSPHVKGPAKALVNSGVDIDLFQVSSKGLRGYLKAIPLLRKKIKDTKYDIIHAHYGNCGIISSISKSKEKLVVSYMGSDLLGSVNLNGNYTLSGFIITLINKLFSFTSNHYSIVKSEAMRKKIWFNKKVSIIPNGVDFKIFSPVDKIKAREELKLSINKKIILFVGDLESHVKNYKLAEKAVSLVQKDIQFLSISGVNQNILNLYYNSADLVLMTSFHEGSPNVIKEAMACNCPIVSTDVGDVNKITSSTKGCFITSFNPKDIADKINQALLYGKTNGRDNIEYLDSANIAKKMISLYRDLL